VRIQLSFAHPCFIKMGSCSTGFDLSRASIICWRHASDAQRDGGWRVSIEDHDVRAVTGPVAGVTATKGSLSRRRPRRRSAQATEVSPGGPG
jgi:hypothetical protein